MELMVMENKEKITKSPKCRGCQKDLAPERAKISKFCVDCKTVLEGDDYIQYFDEPLGTRKDFYHMSSSQWHRNKINKF